MHELFRKFANAVSTAAGSYFAFILAFSTILVWAISGPFFGFSETWQLVINTGTTIVTFLMVFLVQNAQNRDAQATQLKLDELIKVMRGASNKYIDAEDMSDAELERLKKHLNATTEKRAKTRTKKK